MPDARAPMTEAEQAERATLLACYGGVNAVVALQADEQALRDAVLPWCVFQQPPHDTRWIASIDGAERFDGITDRTREALSAALPMPATIPAAQAEHEWWTRRDRERRLAFQTLDRWQLDLPALFRWNLVLDLLEFALPARSIADVVIRQRYVASGRNRCRAAEEAVLADLERLAAEAPVAVASVGRARDRRQHVLALLSNVDTVRLPDREIARRVGVSPQTVGNIRRRVA